VCHRFVPFFVTAKNEVGGIDSNPLQHTYLFADYWFILQYWRTCVIGVGILVFLTLLVYAFAHMVAFTPKICAKSPMWHRQFSKYFLAYKRCAVKNLLTQLKCFYICFYTTVYKVVIILVYYMQWHRITDTKLYGDKDENFLSALTLLWLNSL